MSDRLTAAGDALLFDQTIRARFLSDVSMSEPRPGTLWWLRARLVAIEAEAAARAVDEALSVGKVAEALHKAGVGCMKPRCWSGHWMHREQAAALFAHLRGPRP